MWTPPAQLKVFISIINPVFTIKQTIRTIITFDNVDLEVSFAHGWQLRENFSTNLGMILLFIN